MTNSEVLNPAGLKIPPDVGSQLVLALEASLDTIRAEHPEVPPAVVVINSGGQVKYGHFAHSRWPLRGTDTKIAEIMISGEGLQRPPELVLATLIHEAAHGLAQVRGIKDCSNNGKYHNKRFAKLAEELGLQVEVHAQARYLGHSNTTIPFGEHTLLIADLAPKLVAYRAFEQAGPRSTPTQVRELSLKCRCPRTLRMFQSAYDKGPVLCDICESSFETH